MVERMDLTNIGVPLLGGLNFAAQAVPGVGDVERMGLIGALAIAVGLLWKSDRTKTEKLSELVEIVSKDRAVATEVVRENSEVLKNNTQTTEKLTQMMAIFMERERKG